jgi:hypothetical protein
LLSPHATKMAALRHDICPIRTAALQSFTLFFAPAGAAVLRITQPIENRKAFYGQKHVDNSPPLVALLAAPAAHAGVCASITY